MTLPRRALVWALGVVSALLLVQQAEAQALFFPITPCRLVDTRVGSPLIDGVPRDFTVTGVCGIPAGAAAAASNFTVVSPSGAGSLTVYFGPGQSAVVSNSANMAAVVVGQHRGVRLEHGWDRALHRQRPRVFRPGQSLIRAGCTIGRTERRAHDGEQGLLAPRAVDAGPRQDA